MLGSGGEGDEKKRGSGDGCQGGKEERLPAAASEMGQRWYLLFFPLHLF